MVSVHSHTRILGITRELQKYGGQLGCPTSCWLHSLSELAGSDSEVPDGVKKTCAKLVCWREETVTDDISTYPKVRQPRRPPARHPKQSMSQLTELDPVLVTPLRRPTKRSPKRTPSADRPRSAVMKTAFWIVIAGFCIASAGRATQIVVEPLVAIQQRGQEINDLGRKRDQQRAENERLRQDIAYLNSNAGIEQEARRRGWVKPGEIALSIVVPEPAPETQVASVGKPVQTASADDHLSVADRIRTVLDTCLSVFAPTTHTR